MPNHVEVRILNAFVDNEKGGNPAGVVLEADRYTDDEKARIAQKVGLSETAFVSKSKIADFKLDFFTPNRRIADCGHATIATFSYLVQSGMLQGEVSSKEILDGRREIVLKGDMAFMEQLRPEYKTAGLRTKDFLDSLGLQQEHLPECASIEIVNTGNSFAIIPVRTLDHLRLIKPNFNAISKLSDDFDLIGYYVFSEQTHIAGRDASCRMFAPRYGILEEAGTGMAAGPLACYLHDVLGRAKEKFLIEQGWFMDEPSPSVLTAELSVVGGKIQGVMVGGKGMYSRSVTVDL